jgi:hypothetical protein
MLQKLVVVEQDRVRCLRGARCGLEMVVGDYERQGCRKVRTLGVNKHTLLHNNLTMAPTPMVGTCRSTATTELIPSTPGPVPQLYFLQQ